MAQAQVPVSQAPASSPTGQAPAQPQVGTSSNTSLYVGDLDADVNEAFLFEVFNNLGPVQSVRVCRDMHTKRSLGYAYVNYVNAVDADRAYDTLNFSLIKNRPCRVMWSQRDPALRKSGLGNIFIKNLEKHIDNKMLYDTFSRFGNIMSCKVAQDDRGTSKGYAYIHFELPSAASEAIAKTNGMLLGGKGEPLVVALFQRKHDRSGTAFTNVYVKNIDEAVTEQELQELFKPVGAVTSIYLAKDEQGKSKGFGFVNFDNAQVAARAIEEFNEKDHFGKKLYVGRAQTKKEREGELRHIREQKRNERLRRFQGLNLYVKNLDDTIDDEKLRDAFAPFGTITSAKVMKDEKQLSRGFGFVCFNTPDEAQKALQEMHNKVLGLKPIFVAMHQPKEQRKTFLEQLYNSRAGAGVRPMGAFPGQPGMYPPQPMYYPNMRPGALPPAGQYPYPPPVMRGAWRGPPAPGQRGAPMAPAAYQSGMFPQRGGQRPGGRSTPGQGQRPPAAQGQQAPQTGQQRSANFQFKSNVRNASSQQATPEATGGQQLAPAPQPTIAVNEPLTPAALAAADPAQQKQILGERLFPLVSRHQPDLGPKITGMLLQMDNSEVLHLIESPDALTESIKEALAVLQSAGYTAEEQQ
jgi:polyadenylate-binding protein